MTISIRKMFVLLAISISLVTVSSVWAKDCNVTVEGAVVAIDSDNNAITVNGTTVYGIPLDYMANRLEPAIILQVNDTVELTAFQCSVTDYLEACTLTVNDFEVDMPGKR